MGRLTNDDLELLDKAFTYHPPKGDQAKRYKEIRSTAWSFGRLILRSTPPGGEQDAAIERLQEAVMWANAAIARNE